MTRLTEAMRDAITSRVLDSTFAAQDAELTSIEDALARRVVKHALGEDAFERIAQVPTGWLHRREIIYSRYNGMGRALYLIESVPLPATMDYDTTDITDEALGKDIEALYDARADAGKNRTLLRPQVRAVLASFTTVEDLATGWPEGYACLPQQLLREPTPGLPAIRIADLNQCIEDIKSTATAKATVTSTVGE